MKDLNYYMEINYPVELTPIKNEDGGGFLATIPLLTGCMSDGETIDEAYKNIQAAKLEWLQSMLERKLPIAEPDIHEEYSGKFMVRLPRSLHKMLVQLSKREGVSLNQLVTSSLAIQVGQHSI